MLASLFYRLNDPSVTPSLAGAMIYTLAQSNFFGWGRVVAFVISFIMGGVGADITANILSEYLPNGIEGDRSIGAFVCSALVVTISVKIISYVDNVTLKNEKKARDLHDE